MITMDAKGITWVGNIYQKFENMCLEAEDVICEDAVNYIENQMQTVGESVKKLYSDVMHDFIPPSSCDSDEKVASEFPVNQYTDAGFSEKPFPGFNVKPVKEDAMQNADSRIDHDVDNNAIHAASNDGNCQTDVSIMSSSRNSVKQGNLNPRSRHHVGTLNIKPNLVIDKSPLNKRVVARQISDEITSAETDAFWTSQSCDCSSENQNRAVGDSKPVLVSEVKRVSSSAGCCNEIENSSAEQYSNVLAFVKSSEGKQTNTSSSSDVLFGATDVIGFSMDSTIQSNDCSRSMVVVSYPEGRKTMQQDHKKLKETCVMVTGDEIKVVPKAGGNVKTNKKTRWQAFSLSKKSVRKQEYEELAVWHGKGDKLRGDCAENLHTTSPEDQKKLQLPSMSEPEWELL